MVAPEASTQLSLLEPDARVPSVGARLPAGREEGAAARRGDREGRRARPPRAQREACAVEPQPELPWRRGPRAASSPGVGAGSDDAARARIEARLRAAVGGAVSLTLTDNRRTMVSIQRRGPQRAVRLHHMFVDAPPEIVEALGRYLGRGDRFASKLIDRYIAANQHRIRSAGPGSRTRLVPRGQVHDLEEIQRALSLRYFAGGVALDITWGRHASSQGRRRGRRTIRMGTYFIDEQLIRIHPALDQPFVPRYFVEWVVYHEMLHHVVPMPVVGGRKIYHSDEFRDRERRFDQYELARAWEHAHLHRLIASRGGSGR